VKRTSRSKSERIEIKMGEAQCGSGEHKKYTLWGARRSEIGSILEQSKSILLWFARAGSLQCISFFLILIGFKG
jgi:hypothetical protein